MPGSDSRKPDKRQIADIIQQSESNGADWGADEIIALLAPAQGASGRLPDSTNLENWLAQTCDRHKIKISANDLGILARAAHWHLEHASPPQVVQTSQPSPSNRLDVKAMSASIDSKRTLQLHFNHEITDTDRQRLVDAINQYHGHPPTAPPTGEASVTIPQTALDWLFGSGPDANGKSFDDMRPDFTEKPHPTYWWRSHFRKLIGQALKYDKERRTIVPYQEERGQK